MLGMMPDPKKIASVIISSGDSLEKGPEVQQDLSPAKDAAADKLMAAFEKKDKKMLVSAMQDLLTILDAEEDMAEED